MGNIPTVNQSQLIDQWHPAYQFGWLRVSSKDRTRQIAWETPSGKIYYVNDGTMPMIYLTRYGQRLVCSCKVIPRGN